MNGPESLTQKWLRQNVHPYPQKDRVYSDIDAVLSRFPTLRPKTDVHTFDDGRTQLLLCVHGLLPISFRQASYHIPVAIWINRDYPLQPPIVYVVPTNDMLVKPGQFVDVSGRCNLEYLQQWERKSEGCHLSALLQAMQELFSREPPVYTKPKDIGSMNAPTATREHPDNTPVPRLPSHSPPSVSRSPQNSPSFGDVRPALPPKPGLSNINPLVRESRPQSSQGGSSRPSLPIYSSTPLDAPPPPFLPPHPDLDSGLPQYYRNPHGNPPNHLQSSRVASVDHVAGPFVWSQEGSPPSSGQFPIQPPRPDYHSADTMAQPTLPSSSPLPNISPYHQAPLPPQRAQPILSPDVVSQPPILGPNLLDEESVDSQYSSNIQAVPTSVPPPRPPNPELLRLHAQVHQKITSELDSLTEVLSLDAERLRAHQTDLLAGPPAIHDEMARLEAVRDVCRNVASRTRVVVEQAEKNVAELRRKGDPEVDELVCSTSIVHNQLINLVAEDNAIEDTIYHLHRALNTGRVDLERFLRTTRVLAEEQFMKRALIEKIQEGMPMGMSMGSGWS